MSKTTLYERWQITRIFFLFFKGTPIIFAALLTTFVALIIWFFIHLLDIEKRRVHNILEMQATKLESSLIDRVEHTFAIIKNMNSQIAKNPTNKIYINQILEKFKTSPDLSDSFSWTLFSWANSHHQITVDAQYGILEKTLDLSRRDYIPLTVEKPEEFHLGNPVLGSTSKKWMIPGGVGAIDKNGKYLGALTIGFELNSLARSLHKSLQNDDVGFELIDQKGSTILYGYNASFGLSKGSLVDVDLIKSILAKLKYNTDQVSFSDISLFKNRHALLVRKIKDFPYYLVVRYDDTKLTNELWMEFISRSIELLLLSAMAAILLIFIYLREKKQTHKIIALKKLLENTNEAKDEFTLYSAKEFRSFVFQAKDRSLKVQKILKEQLKDTDQKPEALQNFENTLKLNNEIIEISNNLLEFIKIIIDLNKEENIRFKIGQEAHLYDEQDIEKVVQRSIGLLKNIAKNPIQKNQDPRSVSSEYDLDRELIERIENNLKKIAKISPYTTKNIIIKLIPNIAKHDLAKAHIEVIIDNIDTNKTNIDK